MTIVYCKYKPHEGWETGTTDVMDLRSSEILRWGKDHRCLPSFAYDERGVVWMHSVEDAESAGLVGAEVGIGEDIILRWFESLDISSEYGDDERGCDRYHEQKENYQL